MCVCVACLLQHVVGHHIFTNIDGADPDVYTDHPDKAFYLRIKWKQRWLPHYLYQHLYIFVIYSLVCQWRGWGCWGAGSTDHWLAFVCLFPLSMYVCMCVCAACCQQKGPGLWLHVWQKKWYGMEVCVCCTYSVCVCEQ